jgi:Cof subfamily protein (haloacid dehalogenase superfamily)
MELIVFDLDGTLLDRQGAISDYTRDTLAALSQNGVAYTVATGRTLHAARELLAPHGFHLPHVLKNGVMIWDPTSDDYLHQNYLSPIEIEHVVQAVSAQGVTPFVFTLESGNRHAVYHSPLKSDVERKLVAWFTSREELELLPTELLPGDAEITNISALGPPRVIEEIENLIHSESHLVAWTGEAWEDESWHWIDIHHSDASKGGAIETLRQHLGLSHVICFGDNDNDLSMFEQADESFAPENASSLVKEAATAVIGHHDEDGIARYLRQRFGIAL